MKIGLFGTGAYGIAISSILVENNCEVTMWTKMEDEKNELEKRIHNNFFLNIVSRETIMGEKERFT